MDPLSIYNISFTGLSLGRHLYHFDIDDTFFECFEKAEVREASVNVEMSLEKTNTMLVLDFDISGSVKLVCDRCSEEYWQELKSSDRLFVKFGDSHYEQNENVIIISQNETHFDVSQYIYEFAHLNLPVKRLHPGGKSKKDNCDPVVLKKLKELLVETDSSGNPKSSATDHWEALRKLKNN